VLTISRNKPMAKQYGMRSGSRRAHLFVASLALAGLFTSTSAYGTSIDVTTALQNYTFALPAVTGACPTDWNCSASADPGGEYVPSSTEYNPGTDGIGAYAPQGNGTWVFEQPNIEGSATIFQDNSSDNYESGNTYYLDLWLGTPTYVYNNSEPSCTGPETSTSPPEFLCNAAPIQEVQLIWLEDGVTASVDTINLTVPTTGQWINDTAETDFTPTGDFGDAISVEVRAVCTSAPCNNLVSDLQFDAGTPPPPTPEPSTFVLIGTGMFSLAYSFRRKSVRNS